MTYNIKPKYYNSTVKIIWIISFFLVLLHYTGMAQKNSSGNFEGTINFVKQTVYDTFFYSYTVKSNLVRIDEKNTSKQIIQSLIIDISARSIIAMSPSHKLYTSIFKNHVYPYKDVIITKTGVIKIINGYKCQQWKAKNNNFNTEVALWVSNSNFTFYSRVMELLSKTEDYSQLCGYFNLFPGNSGYIPILIIERTMSGDEKSRTSVINIQYMHVNLNVYKIPGDYKCLLN